MQIIHTQIMSTSWFANVLRDRSGWEQSGDDPASRWMPSRREGGCRQRSKRAPQPKSSFLDIINVLPPLRNRRRRRERSGDDPAPRSIRRRRWRYCQRLPPRSCARKQVSVKFVDASSQELLPARRVLQTLHLCAYRLPQAGQRWPEAARGQPGQRRREAA